MKFEYEKITVKFIERKVREAQAKDPAGRQVTRVKLTPAEWSELHDNDRDLRRYYRDGYDRLQIAIYPPLRMPPTTSDYSLLDSTIHTVEITVAP